MHLDALQTADTLKIHMKQLLLRYDTIVMQYDSTRHGTSTDAPSTRPILGLNLKKNKVYT